MNRRLLQIFSGSSSARAVVRSFLSLPSFCGVLLLLAGFSGCERQPPELDLAAPGQGVVSGAADPQTDHQAASLVGWERWEVHSVDGQKIGYSHVDVQAGMDGGWVCRAEDQMVLQRGGSKMTHHVLQQTTLDRDGRLLELSSTLGNGAAETVTTASPQGGQLLLQIRRSGQTTQRQIHWEKGNQGPLAVPFSLRMKPLKPGERRHMQALLPVSYQLGRYELVAEGLEPVSLLDGSSAPLLKVRCRLTIDPGTEIKTDYWVNEAGEIVKSWTPALRLTSYQTDEATATAEISMDKDFLLAAAVPLTGQLADPLHVSEVHFDVRANGVSDQNSMFAIPAAAGQRVSSLSDGQALRVSVSAGWDGEATLPDVSSADIEPNSLIDFQDSRCEAFLQQAFQKYRAEPFVAKDTADGVQKMARLVQQHIVHKDYSRGFSTAAQVAADRTGDCTEHAVLLAAMLRSQGIPARVVAGLTYVQTVDGPAMLYHMWNIAYVDQGWIALDATLGASAPASRIALVTTDLSSGNEYECLQPILSVMGQIEIEILEASE
ncbi:Transglutaminase-like superfamily protein [Roseimaritima multifibrata]|uniref:Transglutaminase-like superfamily protein n=1 Tax=Roseimaritima multifibrata TaxID=1930274 RepID=A0A517MM54_9BACT|nr:transglutaminase-like domain-containing protein [Roseimaritima multifibrata]QDS95968.1 Transglutaminase-like superfamily protein [Roseimaritima multifibrata]